MRHDNDEIELARMFPGWRFWWSTDDDGRRVCLNATRTRHLSDQEILQGLAQTLPYGHGTSLRDQLQQQDRLGESHERTQGP